MTIPANRSRPIRHLISHEAGRKLLTTTDSAPTLSRRLLRRIFIWFRNTLAFFGLICFIYFVAFDLTKVVSNSMAPTLKGDGNAGSDWILSEKISYWFRYPRRWEIMQFITSDFMIVAKRVVGLPGELVSIEDREVAINGSLVPTPASIEFLKYFAYGRLQRGRQAACNEGYFVLGDDSRDSDDSRFEGPIQWNQVRARVWLRVWPLSRFGFVNP
jgi:signal peptidase I